MWSLATAQKIYLARRDREKTAAEGFLTFIDCESALQLSMLADAGDESMLLTRAADTEEY